MKLFKNIINFINENDELFTFLLIIFLFMILCLSIVKTYDNKTIDKISKLSHKENVIIYDQCFKLEGKYYCINSD